MRRSLRLFALAFACAAVAITAAGREAVAEEIVGILHVEVSGVSETAAEMLESSLEDGLGNAGFKVAKRARMKELLEPSGFTEGCRFGPCLQMVHQVTGVRLVLVARITGVGRNFTYLVTLVDTRTGTYVSQATDTCAVCTVNEAVATASIAVIGLVTGAGHDVETKQKIVPPADALAALRDKESALDDLLARRKRSVTRGSVFLLGAAAIAGGVSAVAFSKDDDDLGYGAAAAGGAFAVSGLTLFVISRKF